MFTLRLSVLAAGAIFTATALPSFAQTVEASCIVAGRLGDPGWAPRMPGVTLLAHDGRPVTASDKASLGSVRQVRLSAPALLSRCDGSGELAAGPDSPGAKSAVPAIGPGVVAVEAVSFPKLRRGGELVELRVAAPAERVTMVTR